MSKRIGVDYLGDKEGYGLYLKVKNSKVPKLVFQSGAISDVIRYVLGNFELNDEIFIPELMCYAMNIEANHENKILLEMEKKYADNFDEKSNLKELWAVEKHINTILSELSGNGDIKVTVGELSTATSKKTTDSTDINKQLLDEFMRELFKFPDEEEKKGDN